MIQTSLLTEGAPAAPKRCFKCGEWKTRSEFYRHPQMGDGLLGKCKVCTRRDVQQNYEARRERYLDYEKRRYGPKRITGIMKSKKRHPEHERARLHLRNAVARGRITKQPCEVCGAARVDAHHPDYSKPLEVRWLCRKHHMALHRMEAA